MCSTRFIFAESDEREEVGTRYSLVSFICYIQQQPAVRTGDCPKNLAGVSWCKHFQEDRCHCFFADKNVRNEIMCNINIRNLKKNPNNYITAKLARRRCVLQID